MKARFEIARNDPVQPQAGSVMLPATPAFT
jgi:hypothetical protein